MRCVGVWLVVAAVAAAGEARAQQQPERPFGTLRELGQVLYTQHLLPFEVTSLLLLVAMVGAVVVAKSRV